MSTSTTNAEAAGISGADRSSMRVSTAFSDESETAGDAKYPEPTVTPIQTPRINRNSDTPSTDTNYTSNDTSGISYEAPLAIAGLLHKSSSTSSSSPYSDIDHHHWYHQLHFELNMQTNNMAVLTYNVVVAKIFKKPKPTQMVQDQRRNQYHINRVFDETMLKGGSRKSVAHSSMSSGELLQNLEHSYDYSKSNDNSGNSEDTNQNQTKSTTAQQLNNQLRFMNLSLKMRKTATNAVTTTN